MKNAIIADFEKKVLSTAKKHPAFRAGDTIRVHYKLEETKSADEKGKGKDKGKEEKKFRTQIFEGVCLRNRKGLTSASFTVRKIGANSVGVERVFPSNSPLIERIDIVSGGAVRRARLYYLRERAGKAARISARRLKAGEATSTLGHEKVKKVKEIRAPKAKKAAPKKK